MKTRFCTSLGLTLLSSLTFSTSLPLVEIAKAEQPEEIVPQAPSPEDDLSIKEQERVKEIIQNDALIQREIRLIEKEIKEEISKEVDEKLGNIANSLSKLITVITWMSGLVGGLVTFVGVAFTLGGVFIWVQKKAIIKPLVRDTFEEDEKINNVKKQIEEQIKEVKEQIKEVKEQRKKIDDNIKDFTGKLTEIRVANFATLPPENVTRSVPVLTPEQQELVSKFKQEDWKLTGPLLDTFLKEELPYERSVNMGDLLFVKGLFREAYKCYEKAEKNRRQTISQKPKNDAVLADIILKEGNSLAGAGENQKARHVYATLIQERPNYYFAYHSLGDAFHNLGNYEQALQCYEKAIKLAEEQNIPSEKIYESYYKKGVTLATLGKNEQAISCYDQALDIKQDFHWALKSRGDAKYMLHRFEEAIDDYNEAQEHIPPDDKPDNYGILYRKGLVLSANRDYTKAIKCFAEAHNHKYDSTSFWFHWWSVLKKMDGDRTEQEKKKEIAADKIKEDISNNPENPEVWYHQASFLALQGKADEAIEALQQAITLGYWCREWAKYEPDFEGIRDNPGFHELID